VIKRGTALFMLVFGRTPEIEFFGDGNKVP